MGFLEDLQRAGNDAVNSVVHAGQDAASALDQATRNTAALAGSGVNSHGQITGPLAEIFGKDPFAFVLNVASKTRKTARELLIRTAQRTGRLDYTFDTPKGKRKISAKPASNANSNQIALTLVLASLDAPATMVEEAGRMANGLPAKPRGLSGYTVYPLHFPTGAAFAAEERGLVTDESSARGIFGIDDAVILGIVVPIIAAIAAAVLPGLISAAGGIIKQVTGGGGPTPEQQAAAAAAAAAEEKKKTTITIVVVGVVLVIGAGAVYMAMRKKGG